MPTAQTIRITRKVLEATARAVLETRGYLYEGVSVLSCAESRDPKIYNSRVRTAVDDARKILEAANAASRVMAASNSADGRRPLTAHEIEILKAAEMFGPALDFGGRGAKTSARNAARAMIDCRYLAGDYRNCRITEAGRAALASSKNGGTQ